MSRYVLGLVFLFSGSFCFAPFLVILSLFFLVHFVLHLVSFFVVIYVCPVHITFYVVFLVLVFPCLFVFNYEVIFLCEGMRYVCHIFHVINLPHDIMYAYGLGEFNLLLGRSFSSISVSFPVHPPLFPMSFMFGASFVLFYAGQGEGKVQGEVDLRAILHVLKSPFDIWLQYCSNCYVPSISFFLFVLPYLSLSGV